MGTRANMEQLLARVVMIRVPGLEAWRFWGTQTLQGGNQCGDGGKAAILGGEGRGDVMDKRLGSCLERRTRADTQGTGAMATHTCVYIRNNMQHMGSGVMPSFHFSTRPRPSLLCLRPSPRSLPSAPPSPPSPFPSAPRLRHAKPTLEQVAQPELVACRYLRRCHRRLARRRAA